MAARTKKNPEPDENREEWPRIVTFAALFGAVVAVLLLGGALRTGSDSARRANASTPLDPPIAVAPDDLGRFPEPAEIPGDVERYERPAPADDAPLPVPADPLAERVGTDLERLASSGAAWTAQLAVLCDEEHVERMIAEFGDRAEFHVLPSFHGDQPCFRLCWGTYRSADAARAASDLDPALRTIAPQPLPKTIAEVCE